MTDDMTMTDTIKVLIAEDHAAIRKALAALLDMENDIAVVAQAADGIEAIQKARAWAPDVVLMDIQMPRKNGIDAMRDILADLPECHVVMLTTFEDDESVFSAINTGAKAYLLKDAPEDDILETIRGVCRGESTLSPNIARKVLDEMRRISPSAAETSERSKDFAQLSKREKSVLEKVVAGLSNKEIARELSLAEGTIKNNVSRILEKLHAKTRTELAILAMKK